MQIQERVVNSFDKSVSIEDSLKILKSALDNSGLKYVVNEPRRYKSVPTFYCSVQFPELRVNVNGKGTTPESSLASAYGEACERLQGCVFQTTRISQLSPFLLNIAARGKHLDGYIYAPQDEIKNPVTVESFFTNICHTEQHLKRTKESSIAKHWVKGYSFTRNEEVMVPIQLAAMLNGSSGLSAGIHIEDAIIQGGSECFERYAVRNLLAGNLQVPTVDRKYLDDNVNSLIDSVDGHGIKLKIKDYSLNKKIPVVAALINNLYEPENKLSRRQIVFGASPNMNIAATRCITEYFQGWEKHVRDIRDIVPIPYKKWSSTEALWDSRLQCFAGDLTEFEDFMATSSGFQMVTQPSTTEYINSLSKSAEAVGSELIAVDLTNKWINIPTVRMIIPGISELAHMQFNLLGDSDMVQLWIDGSVENFETFDKWVKYFELLDIDISQVI